MKKVITMLLLIGLLLPVLQTAADDKMSDQLYIAGLQQKIDALNLSFGEIQRYGNYGSSTQEFMYFELALITNLYKNLYYLVGIANLPNETKFDPRISPGVGISNAQLIEYAKEANIVSDRFCRDYGLMEVTVNDEVLPYIRIVLPGDERVEITESLDEDGEQEEYIITIEDDSTFPATLKSSLEIQLATVIPQILSRELNSFLINARKLEGRNLDYEVSRNTELLYWSGEIMASVQGFDNDFADLKMWNDKLSDSTWTAIKATLEIPPAVLYAALEGELGGDVNKKLEEISVLVDRARELRESSGSTSSGTNWESSLPDTFEYQIEAFANVTRISTDLAEYNSLEMWEAEGNLQLTSTYAAILAASAVYRPFQSHVGDNDFMEALKYLITAEDRETVIQIFNSVKDKRKPLYYIGADILRAAEAAGKLSASEKDLSPSIWGYSYSDIHGLVTRITLRDLMSFSESGKNVALLTVRGAFNTAPDTNSWAFYQAPVLNQGNTEIKSASSETAPTIIPAEQSVTGESYSRPLFEIGRDDGVYATSLLLLRNIYKNLRNTSQFEDQKSSLLYMNAFGDIVLADNTVIISGAANPLMYSADTAYNPYTAAFMNSYPRLAQDSLNLRVNNPNDFGKFMLFTRSLENEKIQRYFRQSFLANNFVFSLEEIQKLTNEGEGTGTAVKGWREFAFGYKDLRYREIKTVEDFSLATSEVAVSYYPFFYGGIDGTKPVFYSMLRLAYTDNIEAIGIPAANAKAKVKQPETSNNAVQDQEDKTASLSAGAEDAEVAITFEQMLTEDGVTIFPYSPDENIRAGADLYRVPQMIALNMYWYYMHSGEMKLDSQIPNGVLRADYIFSNIIVEMLQGYEYVSAYEKNVVLSDILLNGDSEATMNKFKKVAQSLLDNIGDLDGVLGIVPAYSNVVFGQILKIARNFYWIILVTFIVVFVFRYMKRGDLLYVTLMSLSAGIFLWLFVYMVPTYLPLVYNSVGSMFTEGLVADTVLYKAEQYSTTYTAAKDIGIEENYDTSTLSVTIYRMSEAQLENFARDYGGNEQQAFFDSFRYGGKVVIDPTIGMFIQGDCIKINVDVLFLNNPITGSYMSGTYGKYYQLRAEKKTSNALDFYFPFYQIEDGLVSTLNAMLRMYTIPRTTANYAEGMTKDAYIMFNYTNSAPFLYAGDYSLIGGLTPVELLKLESSFPEAADFLNLASWIHNPSEEMKWTLWYNTMAKHGFYDVLEPERAKQRRDDLIEYINYHTKRYLIENQPIIGIVSDENLIKATAMQASFYFNSYISDFGGWVYPWGYNQEELKLNDVFLTALTQNNERFIKHNFNIVDYIATSHGTWGIGFLVAVLFFGLMFTILVKFSMPVLYLGLGLLVVYRLIADKPLGDLLKGYVKATGSIAAVYTAFILIVAGVPKLVGGMTMLVVLAVVNFLLFFITVVIMIGFLSDLTAMGNTGISRALSRNILTGLIANPVIRLTNLVSNAVHSTPVYLHDEQQESFDGTDLKRSHRRFIIKSMNND